MNAQSRVVARMCGTTCSCSAAGWMVSAVLHLRLGVYWGLNGLGQRIDCTGQGRQTYLADSPSVKLKV
jgi:hypothetical protein